MILSREKIIKAIQSKEIIIDPFDESSFKNASYTFTLGGKFRKLKPVEFIDSLHSFHESVLFVI